MKYITGYIKLSESNSRDSILLQQICCGKRHVVLACVCDGGDMGAYVTKQMKLWMAGRGAELFTQQSTDKKIRKELEHKLAEWQADVNLSGILIVDQECWLLQGGESCIYLLNRKFQRTHRKLLSEKCYPDWQVTEARIQKNIGILLGRKKFLQGIPKGAMLQCLAAQDINREEQIERRLAEIGEESRRQGYQGECSAVYLKSV